MFNIKDTSRTNNILRNTVFGMGGQFVTYILNFVYRTVFIYTLGITYLGIQGLFSNILSMLSLAELGVGSAITFSLYKPLANKDILKINGLMNFYAMAYKIIGFFVAVIGVALTPFVNSLIADQSNIEYLQIIYLLYLSESALSYFFSYKRSIIIADQKSYIDTLNKNKFILIRITFQIIWLLLFKSFIPVLVIQVAGTVLSNISISRRANKLYPYLNDAKKIKLEKDDKKDLLKKIRAMMAHRIGSVVVLSTDNLLISKYVGIDSVGTYSNYLMIIYMINAVISQFTHSVVASIGNLVSVTDTDHSIRVFNMLSFFEYWIYAFCSVCLFTLFNPFITIWLGEGYTFDTKVVALIVFNFYIGGMRQAVLSFRDALGLFWNDRYKPIFEAIINLVVSIWLLKLYGIIGIFIGTLVSTVTTSIWVEPYILFKHYFKSGLIKYYVLFLLRLLLTAAIAVSMYYISSIVIDGSIGSFILQICICFIITNLILLGVSFRTKEFKDLYERARNILMFGKKE